MPCITLRDETEWVETVETGWNQIVGADTDAIVTAAGNSQIGRTISEYGTGKASEGVLKYLQKWNIGRYKRN